MSALPEWPPILVLWRYSQRRHVEAQRDAALARLRMAEHYLRKMQKRQLEIEGDTDLDELLADLLPPGEGR